MVKINGELISADGKSVAVMLADMGYSEKRVAVELNGQIVPKAKYAETFLKDGDSVEVVRFVGGG
ncbi:MAG: sulfur carrier protein ThiS [Ruminococcus flavefaciens]|nr:sulfur carrier protein ThiS [Ruminococcus flavefaciens]MCM1229154.1 sulfur carrier protein ThiS [Ruminococcus flavefaciens]